ncbi:hypothetical protein SCLCIDRAFT_138846, partial [Scleroderma citrinum Foug A]
VTYHPHFQDQFSMTFDVYLAILHAIQHHMDQALHRDNPNWRLQHYCPACTFKVCFPTYSTTPSNCFLSNPVSLSSCRQVSKQWTATILPSGWTVLVMLTAASSLVRT